MIDFNCQIFLVQYKNADSEEEIFPLNFKLLEPFGHRIPARKVMDIPHLNLKGADPAPDRSAVFHMRLVGDATKWKRDQIVSLFSAFGPIEIFWLNENSLFVSLMRKENAAKGKFGTFLVQVELRFGFGSKNSLLIALAITFGQQTGRRKKIADRRSRKVFGSKGN